MKQPAEWIWHNGDYEIKQLNECLTSRYEREVFVPPFWHIDDYCKNVKFIRKFKLERAERIYIRANGKFNVVLNNVRAPENAYMRNFQGYIDVEPGEYELLISVYNDEGIPAVFVNGDTIRSGSDFLTTSNDFRYTPAGCDGLFDPDCPPGKFVFRYENTPFRILQSGSGEILLDCGREMMGLICLDDCTGAGTVKIYYGESIAEAKDENNCELTDELLFPDTTRPAVAKAFRYVKLRSYGVNLSRLKILREYVPQAR